MSKKSIFLFLILTLLMTGCSPEGDPEGSAGSVGSSSVNLDFTQNPDDMFTDRDLNSAYTDGIEIRLSGSSAQCDDRSVQIFGSTVTITAEATYILTGTLDDGMIIVDAGENDKPQIVLNGVSITSSTCAPLYILEADKVVVTLAEGTENALTAGDSFEPIDDNNIDGAVFSKQDLTFNGTGSLTVTSPAGHGIVCKDDLVFAGGTYTVSCASHGLDANDSVRITGAAITVDAGKDGIHAENSDDASLGFVYISDGEITLNAQGDGISAEAYLQVSGGTFDITAGGGSENGQKHSSDSWGDFMGGGPGGGRPRSGSSASSEEASTSMKGLKATGSVLISSGSLTVNSADDAIHSNTSVIISSGTFAIATGDDGIHADETLSITDGTIRITESYEGLEALNIEILGGDISLTASDDGLNAAGGTDSSGNGGRDQMFGGGGGMGGSSNGSILVSGGKLYINSSGDGLDANGTLTISGGCTTVVGPTSGDTATLDYDTSGVITGGTFIGTGAYSMAQSFSNSENQGVIAVSVGTQSAGTEIKLTDSDGNIVISHTPELSFAVVILSSPDIRKGETYTITVGSDSGSFEAS